MSLIFCAECGKNVTGLAQECTDCGFPATKLIAYEEALKLARLVALAALRPDKPEGEILHSCSFGNLEILIKYQVGLTRDFFELIVNGMVVGVGEEHAGIVDIESNIGGIAIKAAISKLPSFSKLTIDDNLVETW